MNRIFLLAAAGCLLSSAVALAAEESSDNANDLAEWAKEQSAKLPEEIGGVKIYRPAPSDGKLAVSDFFELEGQSGETILINALLYAIEHVDKATESIESVDYDSKRFIVNRFISVGEGRDEKQFACKMAVQAADGILSFVDYDIMAGFKEKGILSRKMPFEKLKPVKKEQHKEVAEAFSLQNSIYLKGLKEFVAENKPQPITHWKEIEAGKVVKGMNETEARLAVGTMPSNVRVSGSKTRWMMNNEFVIIFTDGVVTTVID